MKDKSLENEGTQEQILLPNWMCIVKSLFDEIIWFATFKITGTIAFYWLWKVIEPNMNLLNFDPIFAQAIIQISCYGNARERKYPIDVCFLELLIQVVQQIFW